MAGATRVCPPLLVETASALQSSRHGPEAAAQCGADARTAVGLRRSSVCLKTHARKLPGEHGPASSIVAMLLTCCWLSRRAPG